MMAVFSKRILTRGGCSAAPSYSVSKVETDPDRVRIRTAAPVE